MVDYAAFKVFFESNGFKVKGYRQGLNAYLEKGNLPTLTFIFFQENMGAQVELNGLNRPILDATKILSLEEFKFILSRNIYLRQTFPDFIQALYPSPILLAEAHP